MDNIIRLVPKSDLERVRLIREARAIYDSIFPPSASPSKLPEDRPAQQTPPCASDPPPFSSR